MTKNWEAHEAKIKGLYAKHTLKTVREIMLKEDKFDASVRAYRQKLDEWGMTKYKPRENKSRNSPGEGSSRTSAADQQYHSDPDPSAQTSYSSPNAMANASDTSWGPAHPSSYHVAGWQQQQPSYNDSQTIHPAYSHQSTLDTSPMSQQTQWYGANYPNYQQVSTPAPVFYNTTPTTTSDYNYSQPTANTSMMGYQGHVGEEYPEGDEYPDPNENCPTPEDE